MVLRKCPKCKELGNPDSVSCPRCGIVFREYRIKRVLRWTVIVLLAGWFFRGPLMKFVPSGHSNAESALKR